MALLRHFLPIPSHQGTDESLWKMSMFSFCVDSLSFIIFLNYAQILLHPILPKIGIAVFFHESFYYNYKDFWALLSAIAQRLHLKCQDFNNCICVDLAHPVPTSYCSDPHSAEVWDFLSCLSSDAWCLFSYKWSLSVSQVTPLLSPCGLYLGGINMFASQQIFQYSHYWMRRALSTLSIILGISHFYTLSHTWL